jgi:ribonuclease HII
VGADGIRLETALASMFAKYLRESAMVLFNRWWAERVPGIRATAGYPQDARRFIKEIEAAGAMPENREMLIRRL